MGEGMTNKNTGKPFERLVQEIYQAFLDYDSNSYGFKKIDVQHDVTLNGKFGNTHQIDVYWEFELAETTYRTIVEVKDWDSPVKQEQMHSFKAVLDDIPGCTKGIFVSRSGFQEGARIFANAHGINLVQISKDEDSTFLRLHLLHTITHYDTTTIFVDEDWLNEDSRRTETFQQIVPNKSFEKACFINPYGKRISIYELMCMRAVPYYYTPDYVRNQIEIPLDGEWYWESENSQLPLVKITKYSYQCYNTSNRICMDISHKDFVNYLITDMFRETQHSYNPRIKQVIKNIHE